MNKGILLVALGHRNYLQMAITLAVSIKINEPAMSICLATDRDVPYDYKTLFSSIVKPDESLYHVHGIREYIKAKLHLYELSPFAETVFLDVDQIMLEGRKLSEVFEELKDVPLTISNTGIASRSVWADVAEVKAVYGDKPFWNFHSEFIYFKKGKEAKVFFAAAQKAYREAKIKSATHFAGATMADELAFQIAAMQTGLYPHRENWLPNFWHAREVRKGLYPYQLKDRYYTYSIGGPTVPTMVAQNYNNLAAHYFQKMGLQHPYQAKNKSSFLPERQTI